VKVVVDVVGEADAVVVSLGPDDGRMLRPDERLGDQVDLVVHLGDAFIPTLARRALTGRQHWCPGRDQVAGWQPEPCYTPD